MQRLCCRSALGMIKEEDEAKGGVRKVMVTDEVRGVMVLG